MRRWKIMLGGVCLIAACAFHAPASPDWRSGLLVFGSIILGMGLSERPRIG